MEPSHSRRTAVIVFLSGIAAAAWLAVLPPASQVASSPWPMAGHDAGHTGRSLYIGPQTGALKWRYDLKTTIISSPAIAADGTIYIGGGSTGYIYAFNPDGTLRWRYQTGSDGGKATVTSSPAIGADGTIYVGAADSPGLPFRSHVYALNPDGTLQWRYETEGPSLSSPTLGADGTIYLGAGVSGYYYALAPDGTLKWRYQPQAPCDPYAGSSTPAIASDGTLYFWAHSCIFALNPDGSFKWAYPTGFTAVSTSPAIGDDGTIYVAAPSSVESYVYAMNPDGTLKWRYRTERAYGSDASTYQAPAIAVDGTIYVGASDASLYALNPDGTLKWRFPTGSAVSSAPAIDADGTIYVNAGLIYALTPDGTKKWSYWPQGYVSSSPAIGADRTIYIGGPHGVHAIGPKTDPLPTPTVILNHKSYLPALAR